MASAVRVSLRLVAPTPNADVVETLEEMLTLAKQGQIRSLLCASRVRAQDKPMILMVGEYRDDNEKAVADAAIMQARLAAC